MFIRFFFIAALNLLLCSFAQAGVMIGIDEDLGSGLVQTLDTEVGEGPIQIEQMPLEESMDVSSPSTPVVSSAFCHISSAFSHVSNIVGYISIGDFTSPPTPILDGLIKPA